MVVASRAGTTLRSILAGALRRCPSCRNGRMYQGFYGMRETCPQCAYRFEPSPGEFTGGLMLAQGGLGLLAVIGFVVLYSRGASWNIIYAWIVFSLVVLPL